jgi:hypothetical protein
MDRRYDDLAYFERRAEDELEAAQDAEHPAAVRAHYHLASLYLDRLYRAGSGEQSDASV